MYHNPDFIVGTWFINELKANAKLEEEGIEPPEDRKEASFIAGIHDMGVHAARYIRTQYDMNSYYQEQKECLAGAMIALEQVITTEASEELKEECRLIFANLYMSMNLVEELKPVELPDETDNDSSA